LFAHRAHVKLIAQAAGVVAFLLGCALFFFLGPRNRKIHLKKLGFPLGLNLTILSCLLASSSYLPAVLERLM
jgi:hypothetical protein